MLQSTYPKTPKALPVQILATKFQDATNQASRNIKNRLSFQGQRGAQSRTDSLNSKLDSGGNDIALLPKLLLPKMLT